MTRRIIAVILAALFMAGLVFAQEKTEPKKEVKQMEKKNPLVEIETNQGNIYLEVFQNETPTHAANFLTKVDAKSYDNLTFHRIVPNFVIQGGDPKGTGYGSMPGPALPDEKSPFPEVRGTVAMARSDSASNCQFYINLRDNSRLDEMKFSAFARVVQGMEVVDKIATVQRDQNDKPLQAVVMTKVHRVPSLPSAAQPTEKKVTPVEKKTTEPVKNAGETQKNTPGQDSTKVVKNTPGQDSSKVIKSMPVQDSTKVIKNNSGQDSTKTTK